MKVLLTGANGFLGRQLLEFCQRQGMETLACARAIDGLKAPWVKSPDLGPEANWAPLLSGVEAVVHTAGIAHRLGESGPELIQQFDKVNVEGTLSLARQALHAGVKRFVFISSIGVNGSMTASGSRFSEQSQPEPHADYATSKWRAEQRLQTLLSDQSMELVIIRPPLVYSGHAPGNFQRLLKLVASGVPLPFSMLNNQRSMVALENLADFITLCIKHPAAANELFLISDGTDISTPEIIDHLANGMGRQARLLPVPNTLIRWGAKLLGKEAMYTQLCGSLVIDSSKARNLIGWKPSLSPVEALLKAGRDFKVLQIRQN